MKIEIKSMAGVTLEELFEAFDRAFADYEIRLEKTDFSAMLKRRGFNPGLSFAAYENGRIISFTYNGTGDFNGAPTAYDTGTGTLEEYRGRGLATKIFEYSIPYLKRAGIRQYLLEVLRHNTGAYSVYKKAGFEISREFYYFRIPQKQVKNNNNNTGHGHIIKPIDINKYDCISSFHDFPPSWQNSMASVGRSPEKFICLGAFMDDRLSGYGIFEPSTGDIAQLAVDKKYRRKGIGTYLFESMLRWNKSANIKIINTDIACDSMTAFLRSKNILPAGIQYEMIKNLETD